MTLGGVCRLVSELSLNYLAAHFSAECFHLL